MSRISAFAASLLMLCAFSAAAWAEAPAGADPSETAPLKDRAAAYWKARVQGSADVMNFYAPPDKGGPTRSVEVSEFGNVGYYGFEIAEVVEDGDTAIVKVDVQADISIVPLPDKLRKRLATRHLQEDWLRVDGIWYKKPVPRGLSKGKRDPRATSPVIEAERAAEEAAQEEASEGSETPAP